MKIKRQRAVDAVYDAIRQAILERLFKPGQRLDIAELSEHLGVSLTPVRNAVQALATEGLIEIRPRSGTFVAMLSVQDIQETFDIRCALECLAAESAVHRTEAKELRRLNALLRSLGRPVRNDEDRRRHEQDNAELHHIIVAASGNRRLQELYEGLNAHIKIARIHGSDPNWQRRLKQEQAEHRAIVEALDRRDEQSLNAALRAHIQRSKECMIRGLQALDAN